MFVHPGGAEMLKHGPTPETNDSRPDDTLATIRRVDG
jgi:hypothetical protein